jgi:hypothetical protein
MNFFAIWGLLHNLYGFCTEFEAFLNKIGVFFSGDWIFSEKCRYYIAWGLFYG